MPNILFVCTANQFRSPLAAACFTRKLTEMVLQDSWKVTSAGTWATAGLPAHPKAVEEAAKLGLDLSAHRTQEVDAALLAAADLIVVMEHGHKEALEIEFPEISSKVFLLGSLANNLYGEIPDPAAENFNQPEEVMRMVCDCIDKGFAELIKLASIKREAQYASRP